MVLRVENAWAIFRIKKVRKVRQSERIVGKEFLATHVDTGTKFSIQLIFIAFHGIKHKIHIYMSHKMISSFILYEKARLYFLD